MGMIVVEGPDGGGKSTLAGILSKELGLAIAPKLSTPIEGPVANLQEATVARLGEQESSPTMIHDRFSLISEPIYGWTIRAEVKEGFDEAWYEVALRRFMAQDPVIIFCLPDAHHVARNVFEGEHMDGVDAMIDTIYGLYMTLFWQWRAAYGQQNIMRYDYMSERDLPYLVQLLKTRYLHASDR